MRRGALFLVLTATLAACGGGPPGDLVVIKRDGSVPGAKLTLRITNDGGAYCNGDERKEISSEQLIDARDIKRRLDGDEKADEFTDAEKKGVAKLNLRLPAGPSTIYRYRVRSEEGTIEFHDSSRGQPVIPRLVQLTSNVAKESCGLPR